MDLRPLTYILILGKDISPTHYVLKKLVREQSSYRIGFNSVVELAQICLSQPLSNAVVERGASAVKRVKTRLRSSLKNDMLASLLHITTNGPQQESEDASNLLTEATGIWRKTHVRNLPIVVKLPKVGGSDHKTVTQTPESCVQTDPEGKAIDDDQSVDVDEEQQAALCKIAEELVLRALDVADMGDDCDETGIDSDYDSDV